ncbi:hypothetical protein AB7W40_22570 [Providencia rettgeri]
MAQSITAIQKRSDEKRGVKSKGYKLPVTTIDLIASLADEAGKSQSNIITEAIALYAKQRNI